MKKELSIAVMATILVLQVIGGLFGGVVEDITDKVSKGLQSQIQIEKLLYQEGYYGDSD